jgi:hypothetical protein
MNASRSLWNLPLFKKKVFRKVSQCDCSHPVNYFLTVLYDLLPIQIQQPRQLHMCNCAAKVVTFPLNT